MNGVLEIVSRGFVIGTGATIVMDLWGVVQKRASGVGRLDYRLLGRWIGHLPRGRLVHDNIANAARVRGEALMGWGAHYAIGITFALLLLAIWTPAWAQHPTVGPALLVGVGTIVAPFFILQPAFGLGIASSRVPHPNRARLRSLVTHTVYGMGLYLSALAAARLWRG